MNGHSNVKNKTTTSRCACLRTPTKPRVFLYSIYYAAEINIIFDFHSQLGGAPSRKSLSLLSPAPHSGYRRRPRLFADFAAGELCNSCYPRIYCNRPASGPGKLRHKARHHICINELKKTLLPHIILLLVVSTTGCECTYSIDCLPH